MSWIGRIKNKIKKNEEFSEIKVNYLRDILNGNIFAKEIVRKQLPLVLLFLVFGVIYINNRYSCEKEKKRENILKSELKDLRYESLNISSDLMKISRRSNVFKMVNAKGLNLIEAIEPPVKIE